MTIRRTFYRTDSEDKLHKKLHLKPLVDLLQGYVIFRVPHMYTGYLERIQNINISFNSQKMFVLWTRILWSQPLTCLYLCAIQIVSLKYTVV